MKGEKRSSQSADEVNKTQHPFIKNIYMLRSHDESEKGYQRTHSKQTLSYTLILGTRQESFLFYLYLHSTGNPILCNNANKN